MIRIVLKGKVSYGSYLGLKAEEKDFIIEIKAPDLVTARTIFKTVSYMLKNVNEIYKSRDYQENYSYTIECYSDNIKLDPLFCFAV